MKRYYARILNNSIGTQILQRTAAGLRQVNVGHALSNRDELVLFLPGPEVSVFSAAFPDRISRSIAHACAYAVEDQLASRPQDVHAVIGEQLSNRHRLVWCAARSKLADWMVLAHRLGSAKVRLVPEQSLLRPGDRPIDLGDVFLSWNTDMPAAIEPAWPADVRSMILGDTEAVRVAGEPLLWLAERAEKTESITDIAPSVSSAALSRPNLQAAIYSLAGAAVLVLSVLLAQTKLAEAARAKTLAFLNAVTVDETSRNSATSAPASHPRAGFRQLSANLISAIPADSEIRILSLSYSDEGSGELRAVLSHNDFKSDEDLRARLKSSGVRVRGGEARSDADRVLGEVILEPST